MECQAAVKIDENVLYVPTWNEIHAIFLTEISKILKKRNHVYIYLLPYAQNIFESIQKKYQLPLGREMPGRKW